jgi:hypothetical protein
MESIMMEFGELEGIYAYLFASYKKGSPLKDIEDAEDWAKALSNENYWWWRTPGAENFRRSLTAWALQLQALIDELHDCYRRLGHEIDQWKETDLKYDFEGEKIDTVKELEQLFWDVINGGLKPGDLLMTIDIKEILSPYLPAFLVYPPEQFTIWAKVGDEWVRAQFTGPDWDYELILNLETKTAFFDLSGNLGSVDILQSLGDGRVKGWTYSLGSVDVSWGYVGGDPLVAGGAWLISGEEYSGINISPYDYVGWHTRTNIFGFSVQPSADVKGVGIGVSPHGVSVGPPFPFNWIGEVETGPDQGKPRDPTLPPYVP